VYAAQLLDTVRGGGAMDALEKLLPIDEIKRTKSRYFRAIDCKKWTALRDIFCDDGTCDYWGAATDLSSGVNAVPGATEIIIAGADAGVGALKSGLDWPVTVHSGHSPDMELTRPSGASGICGTSDILCFPAGALYARMDGYGHYYETYQRENAGWRIKSIRLKGLLVNIVSADG
jgi:SnoaL-like protein